MLVCRFLQVTQCYATCWCLAGIVFAMFIIIVYHVSTENTDNSVLTVNFDIRKGSVKQRSGHGAFKIWIVVPLQRPVFFLNVEDTSDVSVSHNPLCACLKLHFGDSCQWLLQSFTHTMMENYKLCVYWMFIISLLVYATACKLGVTELECTAVSHLSAAFWFELMRRRWCCILIFRAGAGSARRPSAL